MIPTFPSMAKIVPPGDSGNVKIEHFTITKAASEETMIRMHRDEYVPEGTYARLLVDGEVMMSDTSFERRTNRGVLWRAQGDVLIAGLGLGMVLHAIAAKREVKSITVIEANPNIIRLVAPTVPKKAKVIEADIFAWRPAKGTKFNTIYHDIWLSVSTDTLDEMTKLHRTFCRYLAPGGWQGSWMRDELRAQRAEDKRRYPWAY